MIGDSNQPIQHARRKRHAKTVLTMCPEWAIVFNARPERFELPTLRFEA